MSAETERDDLAYATETFAAVRRRLFGIAYRMLGTVADAEDIVQETWIRWQNYDKSELRDPAAFLATTTTRLAINAATSARARRETYVGPWLPEPVDTSQDPLLGAETGEALEIAVLVLLEKLPPTERAAYVLREAFDYPYSEIARIVQTSEASARQMVSRARKHLESERPKHEVDPERRREFLDAFLAAARSGDMARLENLFAADVVTYSDGGGIRGAARIPVRGRETAAKFYHAFADRFWVDATVRPFEANGAPAAAIERDGSVFAVVTLDATSDGIQQLLWVLNPAKLSALQLA
ncbi:RNA polymerase sigma-70 factor [Humibacter sp.]|jgi:RNA polymerase sigma-70 factor (ECF subfamily)|uniref:RNA polymerase sigma-70 factor n=1 Tax=Humibacter sp. TaxID=1940291 RepID=UPI002CC67C96|nr:RNA polymerase sigma-70 factor [Humibacter sp.]HVX08038.1 RNA polymerase sigma-70 factor [Humibacter sp.]